MRFEESRPNIVDEKFPIGRDPFLPHVIFVPRDPVKTNPMACDEIEFFAEIGQGNTRLDSPNNSRHVEVFRHRPEERIIVEIETQTAVSEELADIEKISGTGAEVENAQRRRTIEPEILGTTDIDVDPMCHILPGIGLARAGPARVVLGDSGDFSRINGGQNAFRIDWMSPAFGVFPKTRQRIG